MVGSLFGTACVPLPQHQLGVLAPNSTSPLLFPFRHRINWTDPNLLICPSSARHRTSEPPLRPRPPTLAAPSRHDSTSYFSPTRSASVLFCLSVSQLSRHPASPTSHPPYSTALHSVDCRKLQDKRTKSHQQPATGSIPASDFVSTNDANPELHRTPCLEGTKRLGPPKLSRPFLVISTFAVSRSRLSQCSCADAPDLFADIHLFSLSLTKSTYSPSRV